MAKSNVLRNIATYSIADILAKSILLLLSPILTRLLTPQQYGSLPLLMAMWAVLSVIQYGGYDFAYQMFRAQTLDNEERERIRITATKMAALFLFAFWAVISSFALLTDIVTQFAEVSKVELLFFLLAIIPSSLAYWSIYVFRFMHLSLPYVRINLLSKVFSVVASVPFILWSPQEHRLLVMLIVIFVIQTLTLFWVYIEYKKLSLPILNAPYFSSSLAKKMFKFGVAFFPSTLIYSSTVYVDRMIMGYYSSVDQIAILGLAVSLSAGILMVKSWFSLVWDPHLLEWLATKNPKFYLPKLQSAIPVISTFFFSLAILSRLWSADVINFVYPTHFAEVAEIIPFLVMAGGISVLTLVAISSAIIENTAGFRTQIYSGALVVNVVTAVVLIPRIGLRGAAIGTLFGECFILLSWIFIGKIILKNLNLNWSMSFLVACLTFIFVTMYTPGFLTQVWIEQVLFSGIIMGLVLLYGVKSGIVALLKSKLIKEKISTKQNGDE